MTGLPALRTARLFPFGPLSWTLFQIFICIKIWWHCPAWRTAFVSQHRVGFHTFVCPGALLGYGSLYIWNLHGNNCPVLLQMTSSTGHLPPLRRPLPRPNVPFSLCSLASSTTSSDCQALQLLNDHPPGTRPIYSYHTLIRWDPSKISFSPPDFYFFQCRITRHSQSEQDSKRDISSHWRQGKRIQSCLARDSITKCDCGILVPILQDRTRTAMQSELPWSLALTSRSLDIIKYYILNTLSNTPCFVPNGQGPRDELYWTYDSTLDGQRVTSMLSSVSSPSTTSTLVNTLYVPKEGDNWNELDLCSISDHERRDTVEAVRRTDERRDPERRVIKKQREARTEEWARQTHGVNRKASGGSEEKQEVIKVERVQAKLTKEQPPPPPDPKDLAPPKRLKKDGQRHGQGCCIIMWFGCQRCMGLLLICHPSSSYHFLIFTFRRGFGFISIGISSLWLSFPDTCTTILHPEDTHIFLSETQLCLCTFSFSFTRAVNFLWYPRFLQQKYFCTNLASCPTLKPAVLTPRRRGHRILCEKPVIDRSEPH